MMTSNRAVALMLAAVAMGGCAASAGEGAQVRVRTTTAAFERYTPAHEAVGGRVKKSSGKESPRIQACKKGNSKACNEIGDGLVIKHAEAEARQWYLTSCERVRGSMLQNGTRLLQLSRELAQLSGQGGAPASKLSDLKSGASEIKARVQGCLDAGDIMKADHEAKQSLKYYDAVCEFSLLVELVGEAAPGLERATERGCAAGDGARSELSGEPQFSPQLFVELAQSPAAEPSGEEGMVFSEGDL